MREGFRGTDRQPILQLIELFGMNQELRASSNEVDKLKMGLRK